MNAIGGSLIRVGWGASPSPPDKHVIENETQFAIRRKVNEPVVMMVLHEACKICFKSKTEM